MKVTTRVLAMVAILGSLALSTVSAQPPGPDGPGGRRGRGGPGGRENAGPPSGGPRGMLQMLPVMKALDADRNGVISGDEINNATTALKSLDKNDDGQLTEDELRPSFGRGGPGGPAQQGARERRGPGAESRGGPGSANRDSSAIVERILQRFDKDDDGKLNKEELGAMVQAGPMSGRSRVGSGERSRQGRPQRPSE